MYLPDHSVNMVFLQSGTPGDWALGEFWGPIANETRAWLDHLAMGKPCALATPQEAARRSSDLGDRIFDGDRECGHAAARRAELFCRARSKPGSRALVDPALCQRLDSRYCFQARCQFHRDIVCPRSNQIVNRSARFE